MSNISKDDIKIFGKVLISLGEIIINKPELFISLIENEQETPDFKKSTKDKHYALPSSIENTDLFSFSKNNSKDDIVMLLNDLNIEDLKKIISHYSLGYTKLKSKEKITEYIADQFKKRTTDVFLKHEK